MATLYDFQKTAMSQLMNGKHIIISGVGSGKTAMALTWVAQKCNEITDDKGEVVDIHTRFFMDKGGEGFSS